MKIQRIAVGVLFFILPLIGFTIQIFEEHIQVGLWDNINGGLSILFALFFVTKRFEIAKPLSLLLFVSYVSYKIYSVKFTMSKNLFEGTIDLLYSIIFVILVYTILLKPVYEYFGIKKKS